MYLARHNRASEAIDSHYYYQRCYFYFIFLSFHSFFLFLFILGERHKQVVDLSPHELLTERQQLKRHWSLIIILQHQQHVQIGKWVSMIDNQELNFCLFLFFFLVFRCCCVACFWWLTSWWHISVVYVKSTRRSSNQNILNSTLFIFLACYQHHSFHMSPKIFYQFNDVNAN